VVEHSLGKVEFISEKNSKTLVEWALLEKLSLHKSTRKCRTEHENTQEVVENWWNLFCGRSLKVSALNRCSTILQRS
jgi:hypothetical protein